VGEAIQMGENLPVPPRRQKDAAFDLAPIRPQLEAALTDAHRWRDQPKTKSQSPTEIEAESARYNAALELYQTDRPAGLVALAQSAARGSKRAAFTVTQLLGGGRWGAQPELTRRFHAVGIAVMEIEAEEGERFTAHRLGVHYLEIMEPPDPAAAIRWFTYAAGLGHGDSATLLAELYTTGAPGLAPDPVAAAKWAAFDNSQHRRLPALRQFGPAHSLTPIRPQLQAALTKISRASTAAKQPKLDAAEADKRALAAFDLFETEPIKALLALATLAGEGHRASAFDVASIISSGDVSYGPPLRTFQPDAELAQQFHAAALTLAAAQSKATP
jgi:hypothetical protein